MLGKHLVAELYIVLVSFCWLSFGGGVCFPLLFFFSLLFSLVRWVTSVKGYGMVKKYYQMYFLMSLLVIKYYKGYFVILFLNFLRHKEK